MKKNEIIIGISQRRSVINMVANVMNIGYHKACDKKREREYVMVRHFYYFIMKKYSTVSLQEISKEVGKNHATVLHGVKNVANLIEVDKGVRALWQKIEKEVESSFLMRELDLHGIAQL